MNEEAALLAAIIADPDDDTARLVYADWLDEHDQADRAEFIRVQVALALRGDHPGLQKREQELWDKGTNPGGFLDVAPAAWGNVVWRRGFIESLNCLTAADWMLHAEGILEVHPVTRVSLTTCPQFQLIPLIPHGKMMATARLTDQLWQGVFVTLSAGEHIPEKLFGVAWPRIKFEFPDTFRAMRWGGNYEATLLGSPAHLRNCGRSVPSDCSTTSSSASG